MLVAPATIAFILYLLFRKEYEYQTQRYFISSVSHACRLQVSTVLGLSIKEQREHQEYIEGIAIWAAVVLVSLIGKVVKATAALFRIVTSTLPCIKVGASILLLAPLVLHRSLCFFCLVLSGLSIMAETSRNAYRSTKRACRFVRTLPLVLRNAVRNQTMIPTLDPSLLFQTLLPPLSD